jgi:hypothetical protein
MVEIHVIPKANGGLRVRLVCSGVPRAGDEFHLNGVLTRVEFVRWAPREDGTYVATVYLDRAAPLAPQPRSS